MKNKHLLIPFIGTLITSLSGCNNVVYEYGTLNNLLYNHWNCGVFEHYPYETKADSDHAFDKKEIVIKNLKKMKVQAVDSINPSEDECFQYSNSILNKEKNIYYSTTLTLWNDGYIKINTTNPNNYSKDIVKLYQISGDDAKKINTQVTEWFDEAKELEKEFLEFATIENCLKVAEKSKNSYQIISYENEKITGSKETNGKFAKKINEATFTYLGSMDDLDREYVTTYYFNLYKNKSVIYDCSLKDTKYKFGGYDAIEMYVQIYDDGNALFRLFAQDKSDRFFSFRYFYSLDQNKAKEIIDAAEAIK